MVNDNFLRAIKVLEDRGLYEELRTEFNEVINNLNIKEQNRLFNILTYDNLSVKDIKRIFKESIATSREYKGISDLTSVVK